jgi:hypothetical protein
MFINIILLYVVAEMDAFICIFSKKLRHNFKSRQTI